MYMYVLQMYMKNQVRSAKRKMCKPWTAVSGFWPSSAGCSTISPWHCLSTCTCRCMCVLTSNPKTGSAASKFNKAYMVCALILPCFTCRQFGEDEVAILLNAAVAHLVIIRNTSAIFIPVDDFISIGTGHGH